MADDKVANEEANLVSNQDREEWGEVELEKNAQGDGGRFIEQISYFSLYLTFFFFLLFESAYIYTGYRSPSLINRSEVYYPLSYEHSSKYVTVQLKLEPLSKYHRFVIINATMHRIMVDTRMEFSLKMNRTAEYFRKGEVVRASRNEVVPLVAEFDRHIVESQPFNLFNDEVTNYDSANVSITFIAGLSAIKGFKFSYMFADPNLQKFLSSIRLLLSGCALYALVGLFISIKGVEMNTLHYISIGLGVTAIISTNPIGVFKLFPSSVMAFIDSACSELYFLAFRLFSAFVLYILSTGSMSLKSPITICAGVFSASYSLYEFMVTAKQCHLDFGYLPIITGQSNAPDKILIILHIVYAVLISAYAVYAIIKTDGLSRFKASAYSIFIIATSVITITGKAVLGTQDAFQLNCVPNLMYFTSYALSGIIFLFFQHSTTGGYEKIKTGEEVPQQESGLGLQEDEGGEKFEEQAPETK